MDLKEKITAKLADIKKVIFEDDAGQPKEENFVDVQAADGTILRIEPAVEVGATANVIGEDGETVPAADGDIELADGTVLTVEAGVVSNVVAAEVEEEMKKDEQPEETKEETEEPKEDKFDSDAFKAEILEQIKTEREAYEAKLDEKFNALLERLDAGDEKFKNVNGSILELVSDLVEQPAEEPTKKSKNPFRAEPKENVLVARFNRIKETQKS